MAEIVSEDVMDWARDLAALEKLLAGEPLTDPPINTQAIVIPFTHRKTCHAGMNKRFEQADEVVCSSPTNIAAV